MMEIDSLWMWVICEDGTVGARKVKAYPEGDAYITRKKFDEEVVRACKRKSWNLLYASTGMDAEFLTDSYVVTEDGELKGHVVSGTVLWDADFSDGGKHEYSYKRVGGRSVRLGFSRW